MYAFMGLGGQEIVLILMSLSLLGLGIVLPIIALVDVIRSDFRGANDKIMWVVIILFLNIIGALLYLFIGRNQRVL